MSRTILLADDSLTIQKVVELTFADTEYEVVSLSSGDDLLQKLDDVSPDLVICDIIMPGRDGYEVCQEIKSDPATLHIPVILLSGTFEPFDRNRALAAGCSEIITKPFEARKLVETVEKLLSREIADRAPAAEVAPFTSPATPTPSDPDMQTLESFPAYVDESVPAAAETVEAEELPEKSLDFTDTGFAEMEEAARQGEQQDSGVPDDGIDFEFSDEHEAFGTPDMTVPPEMSDAQPESETEATAEPPGDSDSFAAPETTTEDEAFRDLENIPEFEDMAEIALASARTETTEPEPLASPELESPEEPYLEEHVEPDVADEIELGEPFETADSAEDIDKETAADYEPFATESVDEPPFEEKVPQEFGDEELLAAEIAAVESTEISPETVEIPRPDVAIDEPVEDLADAPEPEHEVVVDVEFERDLTDETDVELEPSPELPPEEDTPARADTGPVPAGFTPQRFSRAPEEPFRQPEPPSSATLAELGRLSDGDVDRIARRVLELASDRFDQLAWEIVPDMAEIAVRQRIRELESEIDGPSDDESR